MKRSKKIEPGIITNHKHKARNTIKRISEAENSNKSPLIIPRVIRTVSCYGDLPSTSSVPPSLSLDQDERALVSKTTQNYDKKIRQAKNQSEIVFLNKAMDFLTGIEILTTTQESLVQRIPSSAESDNDAYSDDFTWKSHSGKIHKSFAHYLNEFDFTQYPDIDMSDAPVIIKNSLLKDNFNEEFRSKYQFLDYNLTLSKIVNLRDDIIFKLCKEVDIEAFTVAVAWSYYLRLLKMNFINKKNRKLYGAICVMIAFKFYEESCCDFNHEKIKTLVRAVNALDNHYILQHKAIARYEFEVYSHLKFSVLIPVEEYEENFHHVLSRIGKTAEEYLSDMLPFSGLKYPHQEFR